MARMSPSNQQNRIEKVITPSIIRLKGTMREKAEVMNALGCERIHVDICLDEPLPDFFTERNFTARERARFQSGVDFHVFDRRGISQAKEPPALPLRGSDRVIYHLFPKTDYRLLRNKLTFLQERSIATGIAIDIEVSLEEAERYFDFIDAVFIMGVPAGGKKLPMHSRVPSLISEIADILPAVPKEVAVGIDGGVNSSTFPHFARLADIIVVGSMLFDSEDVQKQWSELLGILSTTPTKVS